MDLSMLFAPGALVTAGNYQWKLSLLAFVAALALPWLAGRLLLLAPALKQTRALNKDIAAQRLTRDNYGAIQKRSAFWGVTVQLAIFGLVVPFVIGSAAQPWWSIPVQVLAILMVYDFFYYLTHRFLFHDGGFGPGPLLWVHSVHHRQHNPCQMDANYLHPLETSIGVGLYGLSLGVLGWVLGDLHIVTIIITSIAFTQINLHNHDRVETDRYPFRYLKFASDMHHVHHRKFSAGNFGSISVFYDRLFGTYDTGDGWGKNRKTARAGKTGLASGVKAENAGA